MLHVTCLSLCTNLAHVHGHHWCVISSHMNTVDVYMYVCTVFVVVVCHKQVTIDHISILNQRLQLWEWHRPTYEYTTSSRANGEQWFDSTISVGNVQVHSEGVLPKDLTKKRRKQFIKQEAAKSFLSLHPQLAHPPPRPLRVYAWNLQGLLRVDSKGNSERHRSHQFGVRYTFNNESLCGVNRTVAVDCEGIVSHNPGEGPRLAILCLYDGQSAWILKGSAILADPIRVLFANTDIQKVFCDFNSDRRMMATILPQVEYAACVDLQDMAIRPSSKVFTPNPWGNKPSLVEIWMKCTRTEGWYKDTTTTCSNWLADNFSEAQVEYVLADVYATRRCHEILEDMHQTSLQSEKSCCTILLEACRKFLWSVPFSPSVDICWQTHCLARV